MGTLVRHSAHAGTATFAAVDPPTPDAGRELGHRLIAESLEELGYEDAKCARLFASLAVTTGAVAAGFFAGDWSPESMTLGYRVIWFAGVLSALLALVLIARAATARGGRSASAGAAERLAFHGHAAKFRNERELTAALRRAEDDLDRIGERLWHVSRTLAAKRRLLRAGIACMGVAVALCFVPVLGAALSGA